MFSLVLAFAAGEIGLRIIGFRQPVLLTRSLCAGYPIRPYGKFTYYGYLYGTFSDFAAPIQLNSMAFHDVEHQPERASTNVFRVMVIGDSYVAALSCPLSNAFFRIMQARMNKEDPLHHGAGNYEFIAFGKGNQAQAKEMKYVVKYAHVFKPDYVLLMFFCGNDFMENWPPTFKEAGRFAQKYKNIIAPKKEAMFDRLYDFHHAWLNRIAHHSRIYGLFAEAVSSYYANHLYRYVPGLKKEDLVSPELGVYRVPLAPEWQKAYARTGELLDQLRDLCNKDGDPLLVGGLAGPQAIGDFSEDEIEEGRKAGLDVTQPERWLAAWCKTNDIPYCPLIAPLNAAGIHNVFWRHDGHLNPRGNEVVAGPLVDFVVSEARRTKK